MAEQKRPYLGTGWSFPPTFSQNGGNMETLSGPDNVHKSIRIILETELGERVLREDFGSGLHRHLFEPLTERLLNDIRSTVSRAILNHEARVHLDRVEVEDDEQEGRLLIQLQYTVKSRNSRFNMVYPFYLNEGS